MKNILNPFISIGEFRLNSHISDYFEEFNLIKDEYDNVTKWTTYYVENNDIILFTEEEYIISIKCKEQCIINNVNLISSSINVFTRMNIDFQFDEELYIDDYEMQKVYNVDSIGLQCWTNKNDVIVSILISG
ncbi:hypothetical protein SAMN05443634_11614 [Chishuiella changwenlii]|uniref:Uncharacterized protein n=1 Tax=Chishuiella changwenlii TaxID=1434701 RepID=A0A1M7CY61_9FLAO|nr:hypothetical protein [Chishuiella changwenlii]GGF11741.1 hypothetical protein GCM10010984_30900 [Chishuiella changwenlii]SHL72202.1 hypothetical protein SAMN05443634_11614 [Chishuiella changwenlii]